VNEEETGGGDRRRRQEEETGGGDRRTVCVSDDLGFVPERRGATQYAFTSRGFGS
jgi:hypothetical protein